MRRRRAADYLRSATPAGRPALPCGVDGSTMYWALKSIPELSPLLPSERKRLWRAALRDRLRAVDLLVLLLILAGAAAIEVVHRAVEAAAGKTWGTALFMAAIFGFYPLFVFPLLAWRTRPVLRRLIERGV